MARVYFMLAYFDCFSGISGDMTLGALIDLGLSAERLEKRLQDALVLDGFHLEAHSVKRHGLAATHVTVHVSDERTERDFAAVCDIIADSRLEASLKDTSRSIFDRLARAEAQVHDCDVDTVHFHEVGGMDAIVDVIGTVIGLSELGIDRVAASRIAVGSGLTQSGHGALPLPAPATLAILRQIPIYGAGVDHELVTPTGAAIVATLAESFGPIPEMTIDGIGYGAGTRDLTAHPNLLRVVTGRPVQTVGDRVTVIETCIDDMNPEIYGYLMERLFADGALDVAWVPVFMKKNRPATKIEVLCTPGDRDRLIQRILSETTTTGLRHYDASRRLLPRATRAIDTPFGPVEMKQVTDLEGRLRLVPEYEACRQIAANRRLPIREVYDILTKAGQGHDQQR